MLSHSPVTREAIYNGAKYGAIAGLIATWSISTAIAASEVELGLQISTFYTIMGISLGFDDFTAAAYFAFGLHLLTGSTLGAGIGAVTTRWTKKYVFNPYRALLIGIGAGIGVWLVLFLPVTALLVQPSVQRFAALLPAGDINQSIRGIAISAIVFHIFWGAIFGFILNSLLRIRAYRRDHPKIEDLK